MKNFLYLAPLLCLAACENAPFAIAPDGTKVSLGQSWVSKTASEADSADVTCKDGTHIALKHMNTAKDETSLPGAYFGYKALQVGADDALGAVKSTNKTKVLTGQQKPTVLTDSAGNQTAVFPPQLPQPVKH